MNLFEIVSFYFLGHTDTKKLIPAPMSNRDVQIYCVSYIDNTQRVIVFTTDPSLAEIERKKEASSMEVFINLKGILISVINNVNLEIATVSLKDSRSTWSVKAEDEQEAFFSNDYSEWLEKMYIQYLLSKNQTSRSSMFNKEAGFISAGGGGRRSAANKIEINFAKMEMIKPDRGKLKRYWHPGLYVQYRVSTNMMSLKCCIYNMQVIAYMFDNYQSFAFFSISNK